MAAESKTRAMLADMFIKCLDENTLPWTKNWNTDHKPFEDRNYTTGKKYRGVNKLLLEVMAQESGYASNDWMTNIQARKLGYYVKKGDHGVPIEYFNYIDKNENKEISQTEFYTRKASSNPDVRDSCYQLLKISTVFNVCQFPKLKEELEKELAEKYEAEKDRPVVHDKISYPEYAEMILKKYCENEGIELDIAYSNDACYYDPQNDRVVVPHRNKVHSTEEYLHNLCHEIAHSTMKEERLNRNAHGNFGSPEYATEELRAEIAASFLLADFGVPMTGLLEDSKSYVKDWSQKIKEDHKVLIDAIKDAEKITGYVKEKGEYDRIVEKQKTSEQRLTRPLPAQRRRGRGR